MFHGAVLPRRRRGVNRSGDKEPLAATAICEANRSGDTIAPHKPTEWHKGRNGTGTNGSGQHRSHAAEPTVTTETGSQSIGSDTCRTGDRAVACRSCVYTNVLNRRMQRPAPNVPECPTRVDHGGFWLLRVCGVFSGAFLGFYGVERRYRVLLSRRWSCERAASMAADRCGVVMVAAARMWQWISVGEAGRYTLPEFNEPRGFSPEVPRERFLQLFLTE